MESCCKGLDEPFKIHDLEWKQNKMSGVMQVHSALWIHDMMGGFCPDIFFKAFGFSTVHSKQHRTTHSFDFSNFCIAFQ